MSICVSHQEADYGADYKESGSSIRKRSGSSVVAQVRVLRVRIGCCRPGLRVVVVERRGRLTEPT
jgi:hypothetical protein